MQTHFLEYIQEKKLINPGEKILLAFSGGIDSAVLAHLLHSTTFQFGIAHVNFGLRGTESDDDEAFARMQANQYGIPFFSVYFDTKTESVRRNKSIQETARILRYEWLSNLAAQNGYSKLATAHHLNDSIETVLYNLTRGTGLDGLTGIRPMNGFLIRPLLFSSRDEIENYARTNHLDWREDSSNLSDKYARNYLRHKVVPLLKKINPGLENTFQRNLARLNGTHGLLKRYLAELEKQIVLHEKGETKLNISRLLSFTMEEQQTLLSSFLSPFGFNFFQAIQITELLKGQTGKFFYSPTHFLSKDRHFLIIKPIEKKSPAEPFLLETPNGIVTISQVTYEWQILGKQEHLKKTGDTQLDADKLRFPLTVRPWQSGDRFTPLGMKGSKKISDLLTDLKIPRSEKANVWVLESSGKIAWVIGLRMSDLHKVTEETQRILCFSRLADTIPVLS